MPSTSNQFTILAVDDTPENLDVVKGILSPEFIVKAAISGAIALKIVEKTPPDLILLDVMMPEMDGYEVCRQIKANPATAGIPIIFLTAMGKTSDEASGFDLGAADYITKPVNPPLLKARVKTHLALKHSMDELNKTYTVIKKQKERMEGELNIGRKIQMSMVPPRFPAFPERAEFELNALLQPAREVGGDFYDFFLISEDELCLVVGDVSGKGVPAALFMAVTFTMIKTCAAHENAPAKIINRVNESLSEDNPECMFVTLFIAICNIRTGKVTYTNAGHNPPYIKHAGGRIDCINQLHGPIAGAIGGIAYTQDQLTLQAGDLFFMFTDGVSEAMDIDSNLYGEQRIVDYLGSCESQEPQIIVDGIAASVAAYAGAAPQSDDITILAIRFEGEEGGAEGVGETLDLVITNDLSEISRVIEAFESFSERVEIPIPIVMKFNLVCDDLINNIVSYAFLDDAAHEIRIHVEKYESGVFFSIEDDGIPFNPFAQNDVDTQLSLEEREVGGLGIHLVKNVMDEINYTRRDDKNIVALVKNL